MKMGALNDYNLIAGIYDRLVYFVFGKRLWDAQREFLHTIPADASVLVLGGGTGRFLHAMPAQVGKIYYIDASEKMLRIARQQEPPHLSGKIQWAHGTETVLKPGKTYDVIITFFYLDLFTAEKLENIMALLRQTLHEDGLWLMCDFELSATTHRWWQSILVKTMLLFFKIMTRLEAKKLLPFAAFFARHQLIAQREASFCKGMVRSVVYVKKMVQ